MSKVFKILNHSLTRKSRTTDEERKRLLGRTVAEHVAGSPSAQTCCVTGTVNSTADPYTYTKGFDDEGQRVLSILRDVLQGNLGSHEQKEAAEQIKQWATLNGITPEGNKGNCSDYWIREYCKTVDIFVDKRFQFLSLEESSKSQLQTGEYLNLARSWAIGLAPILEESGLLRFLVDSYNRHLFSVLSVLMDRSSVKEAFFLLQWVKQTYFSHGLKGNQNIQDGVLWVSDPLMLTDWVEKSRQKLLELLQVHISTILQEILQDNEDHCDYSNEENLIKVYVDVIQCVDAALQATKTISQTLMTDVQRLCCDELHSFVQRYLDAEKRHLEAQQAKETYLLHLFKIMDTCKNLQSYVLNIVDVNTDSPTVKMLKNMEDHASFHMQHWLEDITEVHLKKYFRENDVHIRNMMDMIKTMLRPLPQKDQGEGTRQHIINAAYESVTRTYLRCLMQRKCRQLEKRWGDVDKRMMLDAERFHSTFAELNISDEKQKKFLLTMASVVGCTDMETLKLICAALYTELQEQSQKYVAALLKWKGGLSKRQIKEILEASQEVCQNEGHAVPHSLNYWSCCCT